MKKMNVASLFYKPNKNLAGLSEADAAIVANAEANTAVANIAMVGNAASLAGGAAVYTRVLAKTGSTHKATGFACFAVGLGSYATDKFSRKVGMTVFHREKARLMQPAPVDETVNETCDDYVVIGDPDVE